VELIRRADVWWAEPEWGRHPVVVMTRDAVIPHLRDIVVVPVMTQVRGLATEVSLDEQDGLPRSCVATADNVAQLSKTLLVDRITTLSTERMAQVCRAVGLAIDCG